MFISVLALAVACASLPRICTADIESVATVSALQSRIDQAWTNQTMARVMPPGDFHWYSSLGIIGYESGFSTNFLGALIPETNGTFTIYPVEVVETNTTPRQRHYLNLTNGVAYTSTVSIANYPDDWIEEVYGEPPDWLSGGALTLWYTDRDPSRQRMRFDLISTSDVPAYVAMLTNAVGTWPVNGTNVNLCAYYSNDIAFVALQPGATGMDLYLHAPASVPTLDLFQSTNLLETYGWTLPATLSRITDPILWTAATADPSAFFAAGNAAVDTDGDGLGDIREFRLYGTSAYLADTDGDGLNDGLELMTYGLNPLNADSDGDGISDALEISAGTNPNSADSDGDGLSDYAELYTYFGHVDPLDADSDDDGLNDYAEIVTHDTYAAPDCSGARDTDDDGLWDDEEVSTFGTDPHKADTDGDGLYDYYEVYYDMDPLDSGTGAEDADGDGFSNLTEYQWYTNPKSYNATPPTSQILILCPHGTNSIRHSDTKLLAVGDGGVLSSRIRLRPFYMNGALAPQRLYHSQTSGFYINGTNASSIASPINVPASSSAIEYVLTSDATARGTNLYLRLTTTNEPTANKDSAYCYFPEIEEATFWGPGTANYVDVGFGQTNTLWIGMPANTNDCRVRIHPIQEPSNWYGIGYFHWTDHVLVKVTGAGAEPSTSTLNALDWRSAYGVWYNDIETRGIRLAPGSYTFQVGYDMDDNGTLDSAETQETCLVNVFRVAFTNRIGQINYGFDPRECLKSDTPWPWTSVDKNGSNAVCKLVIEPSSLAAQVEVVMASGSGYASVTPTNCAAGSTDITITGQGAAGHAVAEARIKGSGITCARLNIRAQTHRTLSVGVYYVQDPSSTNTFPVGGPSASTVVSTLNDVYRQAQISWQLAVSATTNVPYDSSGFGRNYDGVFQEEEIDAINMNSTGNWSADLNILFIKRSGIPYTNTPPLNAYFIRGISLIYRDTYAEFGGIIFTDDASGYADLGVAHEFGHSLNLPKMDDPAAHDHDSPPWPTGQQSLMRDGWPQGTDAGGIQLPVPGRWLRHEDWRESNTSAGEL